MSLRFGTDGVRGPAEELDDRFVVALGRAVAAVLRPARSDGSGEPGFVIGRDPRSSGARIEAALATGLVAGGLSASSAGVVTTPALAWLSASMDVPAAMISASHNPASDNGVKVFAAGGRKLGDDVERAIEAELDRFIAVPPAGADGPDAVASTVGTDLLVQLGPGATDGYEAAVVASLEGRKLAGTKVVIDCANGAASRLAPAVLEALGAEVVTMFASPDGTNINEGCGSTHPASLQEAVVAHGAAAGLAFDGDADRVLAVDEEGALVDGDHLIALCAGDLRERGKLAGDTVVVTVMSNLGLRKALDRSGVAVVETPVGDRYVLEALEAGGWSLGGEQSGHVIFRTFPELATTGDGLLTGVQLLDLVARSGRPLSALAAEAMTTVPQVLRNVVVARRPGRVPDDVAEAAALEQEALGASGRVLIRPSGTEPMVRVMVEAADAAEAASVADRLVGVVERSLGPPA